MIQILLIDDDSDEQVIFNNALSGMSENAVCTYAESYDAAAEILEKLRPDIIFIDYNMPRVNGINCISNIRKMPAHQETCLVLYSNGTDENLSNRASEAGVNFSFQKPSSELGLQRIINTILGFLSDERNNSQSFLKV